MQLLVANRAEAGGGLMVAVIQLAITLGATAGGFLYDMSGYRSTLAFSAVALCVAALLAGMGWREGQQKLTTDAPRAPSQQGLRLDPAPRPSGERLPRNGRPQRDQGAAAAVRCGALLGASG